MIKYKKGFSFVSVWPCSGITHLLHNDTWSSTNSPASKKWFKKWRHRKCSQMQNYFLITYSFTKFMGTFKNNFLINLETCDNASRLCIQVYSIAVLKRKSYKQTIVCLTVYLTEAQSLFSAAIETTIRLHAESLVCVRSLTNFPPPLICSLNWLSTIQGGEGECLP